VTEESCRHSDGLAVPDYGYPVTLGHDSSFAVGVVYEDENTGRDYC
jgi:hypothetical protein